MKPSSRPPPTLKGLEGCTRTACQCFPFLWWLQKRAIRIYTCTGYVSKKSLCASCVVVGFRFESHNGSCLRSSYFRVHQCDAYLLIIIMHRAHTANALTVTRSKQYHTQGGDMAHGNGFRETIPGNAPSRSTWATAERCCSCELQSCNGKIYFANFSLQTV